MPASWELKQQKQVLVYTLHTEVTSIQWALGLRKLIIPGPEPIGISGMPFDDGRNLACQMCLQGGFQYLFSLDSDVIAPADTIIRLMNHNLPIVSAMYCRRSHPAAIPVMQKPVGQWITQLDPSNPLMEVDVCGAGALLIHRSVLEAMAKMGGQRPGHIWFDWRVNMAGLMKHEECLSEDFTFNQFCKEKLGISTYVDTSIRCAHVGLAHANYGVFEPLGHLQVA